MLDIMLLFMLSVVVFVSRLLKDNVKRIGGSATLLSYAVIIFFIFAAGEIVDKELFFEKTALSIILIYFMVGTCVVYVWKSVSKIKNYRD
ncbi:hypothetical protein SAMN05192555_11252 [Franzmannia pantelleriensis]|uniref:Uncharacterized protein n=1 Tax=Franzmannia pantelleriensis TaxID=48727 RepID=A0A1G9SJ00_9GAMM|nr:hypothetical protein SAMN05192555_11252 [Halomonas pantelleriensis]